MDRQKLQVPHCKLVNHSCLGAALAPPYPAVHQQTWDERHLRSVFLIHPEAALAKVGANYE